MIWAKRYNILSAKISMYIVAVVVSTSQCWFSCYRVSCPRYLQCHVSIIPIYSCMKGRTTKNFARTILIAIFLCMFAYSVSATLGYFTFGDSVDQDILKSYKPPPIDVVIGVFMIAAKTYTTYPILIYCGRWTGCWLAALYWAMFELFKIMVQGSIPVNVKGWRKITDWEF